MTPFHDNQIRTLSQHELQVVIGGSTLPVPPYHGGPVHTPVIPAILKTPISEPLVPMPKPVMVL